MELKRSRDQMWQPVDKIGLDVCNFTFTHVHYGESVDGFEISGLVIGISENKPFEVHYDLFCDLQGKRQDAYFDYRLDEKRHYISKPFVTDGDGLWRDHYGREEQKFDGCLTVSLLQTPAAVTLALMRLNLKPKHTEQIKVMHIDALAVKFTPEIHSYTCHERNQLAELILTRIYQVE